MAEWPKSDLERLNYEVPRSHKIEHTHTHTPGRTPLKGVSARHRGHYLHNTHQTQEKNIHAVTGIRTLDPSNRTAEDLPRRPHSTCIDLWFELSGKTSIHEPSVLTVTLATV